MYTAYAHSEFAAEGAADKSGTDLMNALDTDANFQNYLKDAQAKNDLNGSLAAMSMVHSSTGDRNAVSTLMLNGFADEDLISLLEGALE